MRTFIVTTIRHPYLYMGEFFARSRSQAKAQCSILTGMSVFELRAYVCKEATTCV